MGVNGRGLLGVGGAKIPLQRRGGAKRVEWWLLVDRVGGVELW